MLGFVTADAAPSKGPHVVQQLVVCKVKCEMQALNPAYRHQ